MKQNKQALFSNRLYALLIAVILLGTTMSACDDDDDDANNNGPNIEVVENALTDGTWRITYFFDDTDETSDFSGYTLTFNEDGTATAESSTTTATNGTWDVLSDDGTTKLDLNFGFTAPWDDLEDDWDIVEQSDTRIVLQDESGGDGEIDYLTLEKN